MALDGVAKGMAAGLVGVAAMTAMEKVEQRFTGRPNSYVPARTLAHLARLRRPSTDRLGRNHLMHWGTGILVGGIRGAMAERGLRGARASGLHTIIRLSTDQILENATGVGSPPWTWPRRELAIDVGHKAVYSFTTGWVADRLVTRRLDANASEVVSTDALRAMPTGDQALTGEPASSTARAADSDSYVSEVAPG
jgi:hypothetical protein